MNRYFRTLQAASVFSAKRLLWTASTVFAVLGSLLFFLFWQQAQEPIRQSDRVIAASLLAEQARQFSSALVYLEAEAAILGRGSSDSEIPKRINNMLDKMDEDWQKLQRMADVFSDQANATSRQLQPEWTAVKAAIFELAQASSAGPASSDINEAVGERIGQVHKRLIGLVAAAQRAGAQSAQRLARWNKTALLRLSGFVLAWFVLFGVFAFSLQQSLARSSAAVENTQEWTAKFGGGING